MPEADEMPAITGPPESDGRSYVVFTQLRAQTPFLYAGWLNAPDPRAANYYAREHYGRDQKCVALWTIPREALHSSDGIYRCDERRPEPAPHEIFTQAEPGSAWKHAGSCDGIDGASAIIAARRSIDAARDANAVWAVAATSILHTKEDELVFRLTDQSYRLARGYGRLVHRKWEQFRTGDTLAAYEREDLEESF